MTKETVIKVVDALPNEFELDYLLEKLIIISKIEKGLKDVEEGRITPHDEVMKQARSWSK
jgi:predicted transcriptional regulator